jgi:phenylalanyl-tRNA synthetase beta chain
LKLFEVSDVVLLDSTNPTGARNQRNAAALYVGPTAAVEVIHGLVDRVMEVLNVEPAEDYCGEKNSGLTEEYYLRPTKNPTFFSNFAADVVVRSLDRKSERVIGHFGAVHPEVLKKEFYDIKWPCSAMEINIESLQ